MNNAANTLIASASSLDCTRVGTRRTMEVRQELLLLLSIWDSLGPEKQRKFLKMPGNELASAIVDSLTWMYGWTKTRDDQDQKNPYKPFPQKPYFEVLHKVWLREPILFIEKSRTMMVSWWAAAEALHYIMTHQPSKAIFWAQDEDRSLAILNYAWILYEHQDPRLQAIYPLSRPRDRQSYRQLELKDGGLIVALPGKDPNKIRSEHPTIVVMDEACFIENGGEAFDIALASRVPRVLLVSSAAPGWLRRLTKNAVPEPLDPYL